ncbi:MAG: hypothetical protein KA925_10210, partial [Pseudoxanthomonas sp.]|nr:hypothetical protein [Pseudoxanthomonas sp.]
MSLEVDRARPRSNPDTVALRKPNYRYEVMRLLIEADLRNEKVSIKEMIGLTEALTRYEATQGVQFETFATQRIRGAMLDELRDTDWMS